MPLQQEEYAPMSLLVPAAPPAAADLASQVRQRMAAGAPVEEITYTDMPLWFYAELDLDRPLAALFRSATALLAIYQDGGRVLRAIPAHLRV